MSEKFKAIKQSDIDKIELGLSELRDLIDNNGSIVEVITIDSLPYPFNHPNTDDYKIPT